MFGSIWKVKRDIQTGREWVREYILLKLIYYLIYKYTKHSIEQFVLQSIIKFHWYLILLFVTIRYISKNNQFNPYLLCTYKSHKIQWKWKKSDKFTKNVMNKNPT